MRSLLALGRMRSFPVAMCIAPLLSAPAMARCDRMDGPVFNAIQRALARDDVTRVLTWVSAKNEAPIRQAFSMTPAVCGESEKTKTAPDTFFFETLVRIHRATEDESVACFKPAGSADPAFVAAVRALVDGDITVLNDEVAGAVRSGIQDRFAIAGQKREQVESTVEQCRETPTRSIAKSSTMVAEVRIDRLKVGCNIALLPRAEIERA